MSTVCVFCDESTTEIGVSVKTLFCVVCLSSVVLSVVLKAPGFLIVLDTMEMFSENVLILSLISVSIFSCPKSFLQSSFGTSLLAGGVEITRESGVFTGFGRPSSSHSITALFDLICESDLSFDNILSFPILSFSLTFSVVMETSFLKTIDSSLVHDTTSMFSEDEAHLSLISVLSLSSFGTLGVVFSRESGAVSGFGIF